MLATYLVRGTARPREPTSLQTCSLQPKRPGPLALRLGTQAMALSMIQRDFCLKNVLKLFVWALKSVRLATTLAQPNEPDRERHQAGVDAFEVRNGDARMETARTNSWGRWAVSLRPLWVLRERFDPPVMTKGARCRCGL